MTPVQTKIKFKYFFHPERQFTGPDFCDCCKRYVDKVYTEGDLSWNFWSFHFDENTSPNAIKLYHDLPRTHKTNIHEDGFYRPVFCAECISSGKAYKKFGVEFNPDAEDEEISRRTISFWGSQQAMWLSHCDEPCMYIGSIANIKALFHENNLIGTEISPKLAGKDYNQATKIISEETDFDTNRLQNAAKSSSYNIQIFKCMKCDHFLAYDEYD